MHTCIHTACAGQVRCPLPPPPCMELHDLGQVLCVFPLDLAVLDLTGCGARGCLSEGGI